VRYGYFAAFLAEAGLPTLTYDYRGIGAALENWSELDCAAAVVGYFPPRRLQLGEDIPAKGVSPLQHIQFTPAGAGVRAIGHVGYLRRRTGAALWPRVLVRVDADSG
jgi:predicted alpha/beta hydrolase